MLDEYQAALHLIADECLRVECRAAVRAGDGGVTDNDIATIEGRKFVGAHVGAVVRAMQRQQQMATGAQDAGKLVQPGKLRSDRQMRQDRQRVDQVERRVGEGKRRQRVVDCELPELQIAATPLKINGIKTLLVSNATRG